MLSLHTSLFYIYNLVHNIFIPELELEKNEKKEKFAPSFPMFFAAWFHMMASQLHMTQTLGNLSQSKYRIASCFVTGI